MTSIIYPVIHMGNCVGERIASKNIWIDFFFVITEEWASYFIMCLAFLFFSPSPSPYPSPFFFVCVVCVCIIVLDQFMLISDFKSYNYRLI